MNDEFVSHNNSNGGWDVLNKWVSMLKKKRCMFDPLKDRKRGWLGCNCKLYTVVISRLTFAEFHQYLRNVFLSFIEEKIYVKYYPACLIRFLCVSVYWYAKNVGRAAGFLWNAGVTVENLLTADPVFH